MPQEFSNLRFWQHVSEFDVLWNVVNYQGFSTPGNQVVSGNTLDIFLEYYKSFDSLTDPLIGNTDNAGTDDYRVFPIEPFYRCSSI